MATCQSASDLVPANASNSMLVDPSLTVGSAPNASTASTQGLLIDYIASTPSPMQPLILKAIMSG